MTCWASDIDLLLIIIKRVRFLYTQTSAVYLKHRYPFASCAVVCEHMILCSFLYFKLTISSHCPCLPTVLLGFIIKAAGTFLWPVYIIFKKKIAKRHSVNAKFCRYILFVFETLKPWMHFITMDLVMAVSLISVKGSNRNLVILHHPEEP